MPLGPGFALGQQTPLQLRHQFRVFAMRGDDNAQAACQRERPKQLAVVDAEGALVCKENLERGCAVVNHAAECLGGLIVPAGHAHVKRIVASRASSRMRFPQLIRLPRIVAAGRADHFDQRGRAAHQCGAAGRFVAVLGKRAHEGQIDVNVGVDKTGKHKPSGGVDHVGIRRRGQIRADPRDRLTFAPEIAAKPRGGRYDFAVLDQQCHGSTLISSGPRKAVIRRSACLAAKRPCCHARTTDRQAAQSGASKPAQGLAVKSAKDILLWLQRLFCSAASNHLTPDTRPTSD